MTGTRTPIGENGSLKATGKLLSKSPSTSYMTFDPAMKAHLHGPAVPSWDWRPVSAFRFEVPDSNLRPTEQELQIGGTSSLLKKVFRGGQRATLIQEQALNCTIDSRRDRF
jgi:hypothetical protein